MRPLTRILTAYHALANVRLFYQACREAGVDDGGYLAVNEAVMDDAVAQLDTPLRRNPALTPLGRAMYAPLAERIAAL
jgi:HEXXH motif-containing protein